LRFGLVCPLPLLSNSFYYETSKVVSLAALNVVMADWDRTDLGSPSDPTGYLARMHHLAATVSAGRLNGTSFLKAKTTVLTESATPSHDGLRAAATATDSLTAPPIRSPTWRPGKRFRSSRLGFTRS